MSFNSNLMYDALNVASITDLLDTSNSTKGLFDGRVIPDWFNKKADGEEAFKTINFYLSSPFSGGLEYEIYRYSVNCRAKTDGESRAIAEAVFNQVNRADFTGYHTNCNVLGTLPPADSTDVFNTPVEVILKSRL